MEGSKCMSIQKEVFNSYNVTFVFDYTSVTTTVFAMSDEAAISLATDCIYEDLGLVGVSIFLKGTQDITVELLDEDVL
jgi:hypothetical protein